MTVDLKLVLMNNVWRHEKNKRILSINLSTNKEWQFDNFRRKDKRKALHEELE